MVMKDEFCKLESGRAHVISVVDNQTVEGGRGVIMNILMNGSSYFFLVAYSPVSLATTQLSIALC